MDILNLARIAEIQVEKAAEGDRGILLTAKSKAGMELAQLPVQNNLFCVVTFTDKLWRASVRTVSPQLAYHFIPSLFPKGLSHST